MSQFIAIRWGVQAGDWLLRVLGKLEISCQHRGQIGALGAPGGIEEVDSYIFAFCDLAGYCHFFFCHALNDLAILVGQLQGHVAGAGVLHRGTTDGDLGVLADVGGAAFEGRAVLAKCDLDITVFGRKLVFIVCGVRDRNDLAGGNFNTPFSIIFAVPSFALAIRVMAGMRPMTMQTLSAKTNSL